MSNFRRNASFGFWLTILVAALMMIGGCASHQAAGDLAKAGSALTTTSEGNFSAFRDDLDHHIALLYVESGLSHKDPPSETQVKAIHDIQESLVLRERVFVELGHLYDTFGQLASYDAAGEVEKSVNGLTDAVNAFGTAVGSDKPVLSHVAAGFLGKGAGLLAGMAQDQQLLQASAAIRARVEKFAADLRKQQYLFESMRTTLDDTKVRVVTVVLKDGVDRRADALRNALSTLQLDLTDTEIQNLLSKGGDEMTTALRSLLVFQQGSFYRRQQQVLDTTISGMDQLVQQHQHFEKGNALDLTALAARIAVIQGIVADYQQWRAADQAARAPATKPANH